MPRIDHLASLKKPTPLQGFAFGLTSVAAGATLIVVISAATTYIEASLSNATVANGATVVTSASGKAVLFGPVSKSMSTPTPSGSAAPKSTPTATPTPSSGGTTLAGGCTSSGVVAPCVGSATTGAGGWGSPVFDDEFDKDTTLNTKYWAPSWFNGGKVNSNGVTMSASNVTVSGGSLNLTLSSSTSGATIDSDPSQVSGGGYSFGDGYFAEARIYIPGSGSDVYNWPAFWTDGQSWPADGEIDIFEGLGSATSNYHSPEGASNSGTIGGTWSNGWHTYAVDRESGENYIYWDGKLVRSYSTDDGGAAEYLIFSLDCSGGCTTGSASTVKVQYVRVWKKS